MNAPEECPVCGASVPIGAAACPECGADERSGWDEERTRYDGLDLPADSESEQDSAGPGFRGAGPGGLSVFWWVVGLAVLFIFVRYAVFGWL